MLECAETPKSRSSVQVPVAIPAATAAIESAGAELVYLPPYSPDLNPIENVFSKLKQLIRGLRPRNWREIIQATKHALMTLTTNDLANAFAHCGYATT